MKRVVKIKGAIGTVLCFLFFRNQKQETCSVPPFLSLFFHQSENEYSTFCTIVKGNLGPHVWEQIKKKKKEKTVTLILVFLCTIKLFDPTNCKRNNSTTCTEKNIYYFNNLLFIFLIYNIIILFSNKLLDKLWTKFYWFLS